MEFIKKHIDTAVILGSFAASILWMNGKFNEIDKRFYEIEKEISIVKTVMVMKNIMPSELAHKVSE
jgi:hypothetical protein